MRALIVDPSAPAHLKIGDAPNPTPQPDQCLVQIAALSLNHGELPELTGAPQGSIPGWDAAGTVSAAAANGTGPKVGTRVVTWGATGAWAEQRAVNVTNLAALPAGVAFAAASTLPVAGLTALRALRYLESIVGRRVLITGASGGVGRFAVQLAHRAGAHVVALVGTEARGAGLADLGADEVVTNLEALSAPVYGVLDNVGGPTLVAAFRQLEVGGSLISIGYAGMEPAVFPPYSTVGPRRNLVTFQMNAAGGELAPDLAYLVVLLNDHTLDPQIGWQGTWDHAAEGIKALLGRQVAGKAVLTLA